MKTFKEIDIKYYDNSGNVQVRCTVPVTQEALVHYELMQSHYCKLSFKLSRPTYFLLGDFIETPYGRFELIDLTKAKDNDTIGYSYEIQFDAYYRKLKNKILKYRPNTGSQEATFSLTSKISTQIEVIMKNLAYYAKLDKSYLYDPNFEGEGTDYTYVIDASVDANAAKLITYSNSSILDAIANIAQTFGCEWWFEGNILHFGTCENTNAITDFRLNDNIVSMSSSQSQSTYANRVYAFGAARNLPSGYKNDSDADITKDGVVEKRLMLPTSAECSEQNKQMLAENGFELKNGYIQVGGLREDQYVEGVTTNDDIYPRNLIKTSKVTSYEKDVEDENTPEEGDYIKRTFYRVNSLTIVNDDGEKTGDMAFRKAYILSGKNLHIVFQSGSLNGMDFECEFNPDGVPEILLDDDGNPIFKDGKEQINPKSQVFEIVANEDYGRFLPDTTLHPKDGDTFVLYNWNSTKLGDALVPSASNELLADAIKNLKKSVIDPTTYTCTAEDNYSYNHGRGNLHGVGDRVNLYNKGYGDGYRSSRVIGYEFSLDIPFDGAKYYVGEKPSYSRLNAMESKIEELIYNGQSYLNGNGGSGRSIYIIKSYDSITPTDYNVFSAKAVDEQRLNKIKDDTAKGTITWEKVQKLLSGLLVGNFNNENGGSWTPDTEGRSHLITDYLEVRMKAIFEELVIKKTSTIGGKEIISPAGGVVAHKVEEVTVTYNNVSQKAYRCYFLAEQEGDAVDNDFAIGDQVRSESFNVRKGTYHKVGNHFYWRLVIGRDEEPVELEGKKYHYIDLSDTDCATASDVPANGDVLNQCGNRTDVERQNCLIFSAVDTYSPSISLYHGINSYSFANKEYVEYGVNKQTNKAFFNVYGDMYVGDRPTKENGYEGSSYIKYDSATKQVSVKGKISAKSTVDGKELSQYIKENSAKGLTEEQVNNLIKNSQVIADLQNQVDGAIETWFYEGVPTLTNAPASSWTSDKDKDTHLGDLYYDNKTGKAYRFAKDGNTYKWTIIADTDIAKALSDASKAQETADGKMKVFSAQPIPPYQLGDIWVNATYPTDGRIYKNEILRCQTAKAKDSSFAIADWTKASKYTDDSALNTFKEEYKNDMASYKEQLDEKVETWFYNYAPTTQNKPASDWTTDTLKSQHAGDLFYNTSNGYTYRWTGTAWARIKDNDINTAMTAASKAQDTADGKRTVFTSQPTVPYDEGDLWASGGDDGKTLMVCVKSRATGSFTSSEWVKANDSDLNAFAKTIEESLTGIRDQLDKKAETWYQATDPSTSWTTDDAKKEHKGDLWYNTSNNQTFFWNGTKWDKQDVPTEVFDKIDGKSSIYVSKPASYKERDLWFLEAAYTLGGVAYSKGELVVATKSNASFSAADWTKKVKYTDDTVANAAKKAAEEAKKAADTAQTNVTNLGKTVTSNKKAFDNYVTDGYLEPSEIAAMAQDSKRLEDAFAAAEKSYNEVKGAEVLKSTKELTDLNTAFTTLSTAKTELIKYLSDISKRYNETDTNGKAAIVSAVGTKFTNFQSAYSAFYDKLGLANAYITSKIYGDLKQNITDLAGYKYIKDALGQTTDIDGGLVMTTLLALRDADGNVQSGINGAIDTNKGKKSIATWWGGQMVDKDYNSGSLTPATSLVRFDGSGYLANGAIWWDVDGKVHADPTSFIISEKNLGAYLAFFEPTWKSGSNGTNIKDLVALTPQAPFTTLSVSNDLLVEGKLKLGSITLSVVNGALKIDGNVYSTGGMSAYGDGTNNGGGGGLVASVKSYTDIIKGTYTDNDLASIPNAYAIKALSNRIDNISSELGGLSLDWANITGKPSTFTPSAHTHKWVDITDRITKVSQLTNDSGYTTNKGTVTSVKLTLPTGLSLGTTKEITTSGTFAISLTSGYSIPTTSKQGQWDSAYNWYKLMTTDEETADGVINKWNEVVDFLAGIAQTDSLDSILSGINKSITDETNRAKKAEGANATNIATNKANITTLQGYFTNGSAKSAIKLTNARKLWGNSFDGTADISGSIVVPSGKYITIGNIKLEYDATNKALKITNTSTNEVANLYTSGGVSAYGVGTTSSGSTGGGGLNGTVKSYNDAKSLTSESLSEVASAYSVAALYSSINDAIGRINTLEGGSATSIEVTGSGNAVTGVSKSGTKLTFTKGATFLTSHQDISGKSDKTHTHSVKINGVTKTIAATGGTAVDLGTYLTSHQSLAAYLKSADAEKTYSKLGHTHAFSEITGKPTTLAGYGVTDGVNTVTLSGSGNAVTSASIDGHTLTLTKGSTFSLSGHTHTFASLTSKPTTIAGYGITDAYTKAQVNSTIAKYLPLAGGTITGVLTVNGIATFKSKVAIGDIYIINDGSGNLYVQKTDGKTAANFYATGGITAFGASSVSGGTGSGLNGSVLGFEKATAMTSADNGDSSKTEVSFLATAWSIKQLNDKINAFGTGVFSDYLTIAAAKATYQPKGSYLTSHQTIYGLTIQKNGTSLGTYTPNSAAKTINVTVPTKLSELSNDSGYTKNTGTVTSVAISVPTGLSVSGSPITTNGTIAIALASGYSIPTTAKQTAWDGAVSAKHTHSNKSVLDGISSTKVSHWNSAYDWYALMTTDEETADGIINKWNEVVSFLANIAQTDTLSGIVDGINKSISDEVARAKKAEGVNASGISANKGSIATLQGYFTNGSAKKALQLTNARKLWGNSFNGTADINGSIIVPSGKYISIGNIKLEYDAANKALKITNTTTEEVANLYTSGGVSAYGAGTSSSSGGGGLNGSVKAYNDALKLTSESLSEIASAYSIKALDSRISSLEGGSATSIETTGSGNAVTSVSKSGTKITFTKGSTFSLNGHTHTFASLTSKPTSLSGYGITDGVNAVSVTGSGNAVTAASVSGHTLTLTKGSTFSLSNHTHYVGTTQVQGSSAEQALTGITKIDNILKLSKATVTVNTSYKAEQNRLVIYGNTYGNDANYIKSARKLSYGDGGPQLVFSTNENPDASGVQSAALVYTDHDTIGAGVSLSFVTNQGDAYFIAPHIKALTAFQGNLAWSYITNKPTTLSGFGITDGLRSVTQPSGSNVFVTGISTSGTAITYTKSYTKKSLSAVGTSGWTNASIDGNIIPDMSFIAYWNGAYSGTSSNLAYCNKGAFGSFAIKNSLAFSELTSKPTTISGYGITDAYTKSQVDAITAKYLPLTGGTLTGQLKIVASALNGAYNGLRIGDDCYIGDCNIGNTIGLMGVSNNNAGMVKFGKGGMQFGYNGSNHIASTTAQWTNLNADLLDGWHKDNIVWSGAVNSNTANLSHYWAKLFDITVTDNLQDDRSFTFLFSNGYNDTYSVVVLRIRQNGANGSGAYNFNIALRELVGNMSSRLRVYYNNATGNVQLWGNCQDRYGCLSYTIIKKTGRTSADFTSQGTLVTNTSFSAAQSLPATTGDSPYTLLDGATRIGIVKQADQLVTARSLWGQSFNGTANVSGNMTGVGNINTSAAPAGTIYTNNWFRSKGSSGWYSEDHGGGWYMTDNTWIRNFGGKDVYLSNKLSVNGNVGIGTTAPSHKLHVLGEIYTTTKVNINGIILEKDSNGDLKVNGNLYATGGISAYGTSSAGSGGGLNGSVKSYSDALKLASESLSEIASAYSIKALASRISSLEGGSATSISVSGSGNAVTSVTKNGTTITVTKGATFLTAHQSLSAYMKTADAKSLFLYHTRENIVTDLDNFNTNGASHIYEMKDVTNTPTDNAWLQVMNWGSADANYGMLLANDYSTNGHMYFRQKIAGSWKDWKTIIDSSNIGSQSVNYAASAGSVAWTNVSGRPSTMKNPSALSWSGYSSGSYDGSAAKSISIPNNTNQLTNGAGFITASASITGNAATATKVNHSLSVFGKSFNGSADVTVADTDLIASISTATANLTDKTEILTSWASDNGFNDSNAKNRIHRRPASAIWGYINSKTISNADKLDGVHASGLFTNLSNSGNNISITIGGTNKTLTAAYATNCDTVDGYHAQLGSSKPYGKIPVIGTDGVIELGHYIDFHHDNTTGSDYSVRLQTNGNHSNVVTLPTATGTLALTSDNVASATKLQTARTIWGQSFNGTANISGSMTGVGDITLDAGARIKHGSGNLYIGNSDNSNWIGVQDICSQSSIGDGNWSLRTSGAAHFKDTTINGTATINNLLSLVDGSHKGLKMGSTYISSLDGEVILQGNTALRFGNDAWDYDQWAGLKYDHSSKTVYLGIADGSIFKANSAQSGGVINLKQGISSVYTPALHAGGDIYHTGVYRMLWKNSKASKYLNVMNISQDDNGILTIGYGNFSNNKNVVLEGYNLNFRVGNDSGMKSMWLNYNNGNPVLSLDGNFYATGGVTAYKSSDERLKHDIHGVDSLAIIKAMGGTVSFRYNADNKDSIGWIAQRVLHNTFMQDLVEKDDKGFLKINYWSPKLIAVAFGAIEQVDDEVSRLKARVVFLESEVQRLSGKQDGSNKKRLDNKNINLLN
jgi:hypothetical protein|nr:MAG TPA: tail protein [Caudoviricetes sp.]